MMKERFTRAYLVLQEEWNNLTKDQQTKILEGSEYLCLRWLRNEANLWEDYKEDPKWMIGCVACDPNHPDNLSDMVTKTFLSHKRLGIGDLEWT